MHIEAIRREFEGIKLLVFFRFIKFLDFLDYAMQNDAKFKSIKVHCFDETIESIEREWYKTAFQMYHIDLILLILVGADDAGLNLTAAMHII